MSDVGSQDEPRPSPGLGWWGVGAAKYAIRPGPPPSPPSRWRWTYGVLGIVLGVLAWVGVMFLFLSTYHAGADDYDPYRIPSAVAVAAVPPDLGGRWEGRVQYLSRSQSVLPPQQQARSSWTIRVELDPGRTTGRLSVVERACSQELSGLLATTVRLSFSTEQDGGNACLPPGRLELTVHGDAAQQLDFDWQISFPPGARAQGSLFRPATS